MVAGCLCVILSVSVFRVADRLIMERLMVELLELLAAADITGPHQAAAVLQLTGENARHMPCHMPTLLTVRTGVVGGMGLSRWQQYCH
jgi:hypothetical protein